MTTIQLGLKGLYIICLIFAITILSEQPKIYIFSKIEENIKMFYLKHVIFTFILSFIKKKKKKKYATVKITVYCKCNFGDSGFAEYRKQINIAVDLREST